MKNVRVAEPCSENWQHMSPTQKGAFCRKCTTEVIDFSSMTNEQIKQEFKRIGSASFCSRIRNEQLESLNNEFELWQLNQHKSFQSTMIFSLIVVFGLTLFSCTNEKQVETIQQIQKSATQLIKEKPTDKQLLPETTAIPVDKMKVEELEQDFIITDSVSVDLEQIEVTQIYETYVLGGGYMTLDYVNYITETVPDVVEYDENGVEIPKEFSSKAFPNPATINTTVEVALPESVDRMEINLFNMSGQFVRSIHSGELKRGTTRFPVDLSDLNTGLYIVTILSKDYSESLRISKL